MADAAHAEPRRARLAEAGRGIVMLRNRLSRLPLLIVLAGLPVAFAGSEPDCDAFGGDETALPGELLPDPGSGKGWKLAKLADRGDVADAVTELDVEADPLVLTVDLGIDGEKGLLLASPDGRLCGNAGCPYVLLEARSLRRIGSFFGHIAVLEAQVNRHPIIQTYSRHRAMATRIDTFAFDGKVYRLVAHLIVDPCSFALWGRQLHPLRKGETK